MDHDLLLFRAVLRIAVEVTGAVTDADGDPLDAPAVAVAAGDAAGHPTARGPIRSIECARLSANASAVAAITRAGVIIARG